MKHNWHGPAASLRFALLLCLNLIRTAQAQPVPPAWLTPAAAAGPNQVALSWQAVGGAGSYNVKRSTTAGGPHTLVANVATTNYTETPPTSGETYFYAVTAVSPAGESLSFREVAAAACLVLDNSDATGVTLTGSWTVSGVAGCYGANSVFASTTNGSLPTAACTFTPLLPRYGNYDVYLRWTAAANRATNAPVDIVFADAQTTVTVDQTQNNGQWMLLGTFPFEPGTNASVTLRNNTGGTGKYLSADAVQFVPRLSPWGPRATNIGDYTVTTFADDISGTNLDTAKWAIALGRPNVSVADGKISLDLNYIGTNPLAQASSADLKNVNNWRKGAVQPVEAQKFGYYEARYRVNQDGGGTDNAYWFAPPLEAVPWEGFEYDTPEIFTQPAASFANTDASYGIWNHVTGAHLWNESGGSASYNNVGASWGLAGYHTLGMEWRTDNTLVMYFDGVERTRASIPKVNAANSILPVNTLLSTYPGDWMLPTTNLDGQSMKVDYLRCYQKPGWLGALSAAWSNPANWGPDGVPGPGLAAVFNLAVAQSAVALASNQPVQSLSFDHAHVSAMTINGPGQLWLGAGTNSVLRGGISMGSSVTAPQTVNADIVAQTELSFFNSSHSDAPLVLNGQISGNGVALRGLHFACGAPIVVSQPLANTIGEVVAWGGTPLALPTNCAHVGRTVIDSTTLVVGRLGNGGEPSSVGASLSSATNLLLFSTRKHSEPYRARLRYNGPGETSRRGLTLDRAAEGILEASGSAPLVLAGPVVLNPGVLADGTTTASVNLILGGTNTGNNTLASDLLTRSGASLTLTKRDSGTWVLTGNVLLSNSLSVTGGRLQSGFGTNGTLEASSVAVSSGAEFAIGRDDDTSFEVPITGSSGNFRKTGAGKLALTGINNYSGTTTVEAGTLLGNNTGSGALALLGGSFDLNGGNRSAGEVVLNGGSITNSLGGNNYYLAGSPFRLQSGSISSRLGGGGAIVKSGGGTVTLTGGNTQLGGTTVSNGTLWLNSPGTLASAVVVNGGVFGGNGTVNSDVTVNGGVLAPGSSPGVLTVAGDFVLNSDGLLRVELFGTIPGTQYDQLKLSGANRSVSLGGSLEVLTTNSFPLGASFVIVTNTGSVPVSGTFAGRPQGCAFAAPGNWFRISYTAGNGNDVLLTRIATPSAPALSAQWANRLPRLILSGITNVNYRVLASADLVNWTPLLTTNPPALPFEWTDTSATNFPARFYRVAIGL